MTCNFTPGSARLSNICKAKLDEVALKMKQDPAMQAQVIGYADGLALNDTRRIAPCHRKRPAQATQPIGLLGPHQRLEPGAVRRIGDVDRMEIQAAPPCHARLCPRQWRRRVGATGKHRRIRRCGRQLPMPVVVAVAIGQQTQTGRGTHFEQRQRLRQACQHRQKRGATAGLIGLRAMCQHRRAHGGCLLTQQAAELRPVAWRVAHMA